MMKKRIHKIKNVQQRNEWFDSLPVAQKRVEIAKDVIDSLKSEHFSAADGYFELRSRNTFSRYCDLQSVVTSAGVTCRGCAIAGVFYSKIFLGNGGTYTNMYEQHIAGLDDVEIHDNLKSIFTTKQLGLIETAYECGRHYAEKHGNSYHISARAYRWGSKRVDKYSMHSLTQRQDFLNKFGYPKSLNQREYINLRTMIDIMQNIINNKGRFRV